MKRAGNRLYLVGRTRDQMAGSALYARHDAPHPHAPDVDLPSLSASTEAILEAVDRGWLESCHDVSDGGLAVTLAEMCIGGQLGADVDLAAQGRMRPAALLFSESNTRWVIEVTPGRARHVERMFKRHGVDLTALGKVAAKPAGSKGKAKGRAASATPALRIMAGRKVLLNVPVPELEEAWTGTFWGKMG